MFSLSGKSFTFFTGFLAQGPQSIPFENMTLSSASSLFVVDLCGAQRQAADS